MGQRPFPGAKYSIIDNVVTGTRPHRPSSSNEWLSGDIWDLISRCWSPLQGNRPDPNAIINTLNDAGDTVEFRSRGFREVDLIPFLNGCKDVAKGGQDAKKAQVIVDTLDLVRQLWD